MGQHCALLWPSKQSHRSLSADRRGYCPNGFCSLMFGYKNSRSAAATLVPLRSFSAAKISIFFRPCKFFGKNLSSCHTISFNGRQIQLPFALRLQPGLPYYMVPEVPPQAAPVGHRRSTENTACGEGYEDGMQHRTDRGQARPCAYLHQDTAEHIARQTGTRSERLYGQRPAARAPVAAQSSMPLVTLLLCGEYWSYLEETVRRYIEDQKETANRKSNNKRAGSLSSHS